VFSPDGSTLYSAVRGPLLGPSRFLVLDTWRNTSLPSGDSTASRQPRLVTCTAPPSCTRRLPHLPFPTAVRPEVNPLPVARPARPNASSSGCAPSGLSAAAKKRGG
jgi:hypothetical protein